MAVILQPHAARRTGKKGKGKGRERKERGKRKKEKERKQASKQAS